MSRKRDSWPTYSTEIDLKRDQIIDSLEDDKCISDLYPVDCNETFKKLSDDPAFLKDLRLKGLPTDTTAFELFLDADEFVIVVVITDSYTAEYLLITDHHGGYYIDNEYLRRIELRREMKLD